MYEVHDWAEVHRLFERERLSKAAIAKRLGISRPTVIRLLGLDQPPRYQRESPGSKLDAYKHAIAAMLDGDPVAVAAMVDRLVHHAEVIALKGDSYRLKGHRKEVAAATQRS